MLLPPGDTGGRVGNGAGGAKKNAWSAVVGVEVGSYIIIGCWAYWF